MKHLIALLALALLPFGASAQKKEKGFERPEQSYNYNRALELYNNDSYSEAYPYLERELQNNGKNGYAYGLRGSIDKYCEDYGKALTAFTKALKYLPPKDEMFVTWAYRERAEVYLALGDTARAYADYDTGIKRFPEDMELRRQRAQLYFNQKRYDESDRDYRTMIEIDPGDETGHMGLGRNADRQKRYTEALKHFDYVIKIAPDYSSGYSFRAETHMHLGQWASAADDVVTAIGIDHDLKAFYVMKQLADSSLNSIATKLKIQAMKQPQNGIWPYCQGMVYKRAKHYQQAIAAFQKSFELDARDMLLSNIADCYDELGMYDMAILYIDRAIGMDAEDNDYLMDKARFLCEAGRTEEAIAVAGTVIEREPDRTRGYYCRAWIRHEADELTAAIEDYDMAIALRPSFAYAYCNRGTAYDWLGNAKQAKADWEEAIRLDTVPEENSCAMFALARLGRTEEAVDFMRKVLEKDEDNTYDAACLYAIIGQPDTAIHYLRQALENGYRCFHHISRDHDLDNLRELPEFRALIEEYQQKHAAFLQENAEETEAIADSTEVDVPFTKEGGVCKVMCKINDLPLHFVFDTGASTVSISNVEATFMWKNGYIKREDVVGKQNFVDANGDVSEGTVINLRRIDFGGLTLDNVRASVVRNQRAPLLLGQTVLGRLGKIEIDNKEQIIRVSGK